ncbi:MAG: DNRLRE domain-containing protein [Actinobacteria bacterium]|nr:DNRLRE domain-containing protein [Actinomycetota bacterium]
MRVSGSRQTYIRFDVDNRMNDDRVVHYAWLELLNSTPGNSSTQVAAKRPIQAWPSTMTWNNRPDVNTTTLATATGEAGTWFVWVLGELYQHHIDTNPATHWIEPLGAWRRSVVPYAMMTA